jgi:hypothetical protein
MAAPSTSLSPIQMANDNPPVVVRAPTDVRELPESTSDVHVMDVLDDEMVLALTRLPRLRLLWQSGNSRITDAGIRALASLDKLEELDLEWSGAITDDALEILATFPNLRYVDLSFCSGLTGAGLARLRHARPTLTIDTEYACVANREPKR